MRGLRLVLACCLLFTALEGVKADPVNNTLAQQVADALQALVARGTSGLKPVKRPYPFLSQTPTLAGAPPALTPLPCPAGFSPTPALQPPPPGVLSPPPPFFLSQPLTSPPPAWPSPPPPSPPPRPPPPSSSPPPPSPPPPPPPFPPPPPRRLPPPPPPPLPPPPPPADPCQQQTVSNRVLEGWRTTLSPCSNQAPNAPTCCQKCRTLGIGCKGWMFTELDCLTSSQGTGVCYFFTDVVDSYLGDEVAYFSGLNTY